MRREISQAFYNRIERLIRRYKRAVYPKPEAWFEEEIFEFVDELRLQITIHTFQKNAGK
mgnify:CR=1 FL=1